MTRCYLPPPLHPHAQVTLPRATALHVVRVLRMRVGARLTVFDGCGGEYPAEIATIGREEVRIALEAHQPIERESSLHVTLMQGLARGERMDLIVQKATELGVGAIVPVASEHSVVRLKDAAARRRLEHWRQVAISACEQCGRNRIPSVVDVTDVASACDGVASGAQRYLLSVAAPASLAAALRPEREVALLIGPEGGLSEAEIAIARRFDFQPVRLGPRVLRTETAPLAALAVLQALSGDLR